MSGTCGRAVTLPWACCAGSLARAPDDFAYAAAKALDEHQDLFQWSMQNFSYNSRAVWKAHGVPLHPGAARYYREMKYMK